MIMSFLSNQHLLAHPTSNDCSFKLLHLTFHRGCEREIEAIAQEFNMELTTWFLPDLPPLFFDGVSKGNALYNIGHDRAERIWNIHKDFFDQFDAVITSDTAPLCRIFLQNGWEKPLIIWICNRFDYADAASLDCEFPDQEYYSLFQQASEASNVYMIAYTAFEHYYAKTKGIDTGLQTIAPCAPYFDVWNSSPSPHPQLPPRFFLPPYHNETKFMDLSTWLTELEIPNYCGRYSNPLDLTQYQGIIHLPYSWSNLAFFENITLGIPYFVPSVEFFKELAAYGNYFHPNLHALLENDLFCLSEWYSAHNRKAITYFDSWDDLVHKIQTMNYTQQRLRIKSFAQLHQNIMLRRWRNIFNKIRWGVAPLSAIQISGYKTVSLESLDLTQIALLKNAKDDPHFRSVYYDKALNQYIKIWSENYPEAGNFLKAIASGFYDHLAPLEAIVVDKDNRCRGYVTKGLKNSNLQLSFCKNRHGSVCLQNSALQNLSYQEFYAHLLQTCQEKGLYYLDLTPGNILLDADSYYLADLECVYTCDQLLELQKNSKGKFTFILDHLPKDYAQFLETIIQ
jgi:hypothetical protein